MAQCAIHRIFFLSTVVVWMCVTMYVLKVWSGYSMKKSYSELQSTANVMEELKRQNLQLKEIATYLSNVLEEKNKDQSNVASNISNTSKSVFLLQKQLKDCTEKSGEVSRELRNLNLKITRLQSSNNTIHQDSIGSYDVNSESLESLTIAAYDNILEFWYFINSKLQTLQGTSSMPSGVVDTIAKMIEEARERKSAALIEIELLQKNLENLKAAKMKRLHELVQKRLRYVQNPHDCEDAKKLVCNVNKGCGFGCQIHHVLHCFLVAIGTKRTLVLESKNWRYAPDGWESVFLPVSKTCTDAGHGSSRIKWNGEEETKNHKVVYLYIVDSMVRRPPYLPLAVPEDLASDLIKYHGNPPAWWMGEVISYLMRPQPDLAMLIEKFEEKIGFDHPIVGIHIRRTDKIGSEASFHSISEYMVHVIDWYDKEDLKRKRDGQPKLISRKVYIASDDSSVLDETRRLYPQYTFVGDSAISKSAATFSRYSKTSLIGVITDVFLLSKCDYLVGTFSSQVSRLAYELMQPYHSDAATYVHSLDDIFYYGGQGKRYYKAIYDHVPNVNAKDPEIELRVGDPVGVAGNHWDGFSKGTNLRTGKTGLYPSYKVKETVQTAKFPTYPEADMLQLDETDDTK